MRNEKITPLYERLSRDDELQGESSAACDPCNFSVNVHSKPPVIFLAQLAVGLILLLRHQQIRNQIL